LAQASALGRFFALQPLAPVVPYFLLARSAMDPFADALAAAHEQGAALQASMAPRQDVALSPDLSHEEARITSDIQNSAIENASEDCEDAGEDCTRGAKMSDRWKEEGEQWVPAKAKRTRQDNETPRVKGRRKLTADNALKLLPVPAAEMAQMKVPLVFVTPAGVGKPQLPIPLWPQYKVDWGTFDLEGPMFLSVASEEHWLMRMIDGQTKVPVRTVAKKFVDQFRSEFNARMQVARFDLRLPTSSLFDVDDILPQTQYSFKSTRGRESPMIKIQIAETSITCVNTMQRILLKLDTATESFISAVMAPAIKNVANSLATLKEVRPPIVPSDSQESSQTYQLGFNCTPNLRDKVTWRVSMHSWHVLVKKPKAKVREYYAVDSALSPEDYNAQKISMYWEAVKHWNEIDGTKRIRITVPAEPRTPSSPSDA